MKRLINFFFFTRRERLGSVVLLVLCAGIFAVPSFRERLPLAGNTDFRPFENQIQAFKADELRDSLPDTPPRPFNFDPNLATETDFISLGLPPKVASRICHYREKGGKFRQADDFGKIWDLSPEDFERLKPFIRIQEASPRSFEKTDKPEPYSGSPNEKYTARGAQHFSRKYTPEPVDINSAGQEAWMALPMVAEKRAAQIIRFRDVLGGFQSVEQVGEMYNLPDSVFQTIKPFLYLESPIYRKINLNQATVETLNAHPYISGKQATLIVNYRDQHGPFQAVEEVLNIRAFQDDAWWKKVQPYFTVE